MIGWPALALLYATQLLAGWALVARLHGAAPLPGRQVLPRALLVGPAALALQMFVYDACGVAFSLLAVLLPWWILAVLWRRRLRGPFDAPAPASAERVSLGLVGAIFLAAVGVGLLVPVHEGDPVNNFLLPARLYASYQGLAPEALAGLVLPGRVEHPPLVALNEALVWLAAGDGAFLGVKPFFAFALLAWLLLVVEACFRDLRGRVAVLAVAFLACHPQAFAASTVGMADLRLGASVLLLILAGRDLLQQPGGPAAWRFVAYAGLCAWTKNEGSVLAIAAACLPLVLLWRRRLRLAQALPAATALLLFCAAWPAWLHAHRIAQPYLAGAAQVGFFQNLGRVPAIAAAFARLVLYGQAEGIPSLEGLLIHGLTWPLALLAAALALLRPGHRRRVLPWVLLLAAHLGLYVLALVPTPQPRWFVLMSAPRLLLHATPWAIVLLTTSLGVLGAAPHTAQDASIRVGGAAGLRG